MTITIYFFTILLNLSFLISKKKSKFIMNSSLIIIIILMVGNGLADNSLRDYSTYLYHYDGISRVQLLEKGDLLSVFTSEIGMTILMKLGNFLGFSFFYFRFLIITLCVLTIFIPLNNSKVINGHLNIILYLLHPIMIDSVQFSNFVAVSFLIISIKYLSYKTKRGNILFLIYIFIASQFHAVFIVYLSLLLINVTKKKILIRIIASVALIMAFLTFSGYNYIDTLVNGLIGYVNNPVYRHYLNENNIFAAFGVMLIHMVNIVTTKKSKEFATNNLKGEQIRSSNYINNTYWIHINSIIFFVLYLMNINFYRLPRNYALINYNTYSMTFSSLSEKSLSRLVYLSFIIGSTIMWFIFEYISLGVFEGVVIPFFTKNLFFN